MLNWKMDGVQSSIRTVKRSRTVLSFVFLYITVGMTLVMPCNGCIWWPCHSGGLQHWNQGSHLHFIENFGLHICFCLLRKLHTDHQWQQFKVRSELNWVGFSNMPFEMWGMVCMDVLRIWRDNYFFRCLKLHVKMFFSCSFFWHLIFLVRSVFCDGFTLRGKQQPRIV